MTDCNSTGDRSGTSCHSITDENVMYLIKDTIQYVIRKKDFINNYLFRNFKTETFTGQISTLKVQMKNNSQR